MAHLAFLAALLLLGGPPAWPDAVLGCALVAWLRLTADAPLLPSPANPPLRRTRVSKQFTTEKRQPETIVFSIDDDEFHFTPVKVAPAMLPVLDPKSRRNRGARPSANGDGPSDDDGENEDEATATAREDQSMTQAAWQWLYDGLPDEEWDRLVGRLRDPEDGLDLQDVVGVVRWLMGQATGRPTTSRRG